MFRAITYCEIFSFGGGESHRLLSAAFPGGKKTLNVEHKAGCGASSVNVTSIVSVSVAFYQKPLSFGGCECEAEGRCAFDVTEEMLHSGPVRLIVSRVETSKVADGKNNIRTVLYRQKV